MSRPDAAMLIAAAAIYPDIASENSTPKNLHLAELLVPKDRNISYSFC